MATPLRAAALALLLLAAPLVAAAGERSYVAQSFWSAKHLAGVDAAWLATRPLWSEKVAGEEVRVAIVSTGVDPTHPDLEGAVVAWKDFVGDRPEPYDDHGQGTYLAGVVAGRGHFQWSPLRPYWVTGARGMAPEAQLVVAKVVHSTEAVSDEAVAAAVRWAGDPDGDGSIADAADILLLPVSIERPRAAPISAGRMFLGPLSEAAIRDALDLGIVVVAPVGNLQGKKPIAPAEIPGVIAVGAVDREGALADFNAEGRDLDLLAPGVLIGPWPKALDVKDYAADGYSSVAGTAVAAAYVAGGLALVLEADPALRERAPVLGVEASTQAQALLKKTAAPLPDRKPEEQGAGLARFDAAVASVDAGTEAFDPAFLTFLGLVAAAALALAVRSFRARRGRKVAPKHGD